MSSLILPPKFSFPPLSFSEALCCSPVPHLLRGPEASGQPQSSSRCFPSVRPFVYFGGLLSEFRAADLCLPPPNDVFSTVCPSGLLVPCIELPFTFAYLAYFGLFSSHLLLNQGPLDAQGLRIPFPLYWLLSVSCPEDFRFFFKAVALDFLFFLSSNASPRPHSPDHRSCRSLVSLHKK